MGRFVNQCCGFKHSMVTQWYLPSSQWESVEDGCNKILLSMVIATMHKSILNKYSVNGIS